MNMAPHRFAACSARRFATSTATANRSRRSMTHTQRKATPMPTAPIQSNGAGAAQYATVLTNRAPPIRSLVHWISWRRWPCTVVISRRCVRCARYGGQNPRPQQRRRTRLRGVRNQVHHTCQSHSHSSIGPLSGKRWYEHGLASHHTHLCLPGGGQRRRAHRLYRLLLRADVAAAQLRESPCGAPVKRRSAYRVVRLAGD